jgi:hypothetical protein
VNMPPPAYPAGTLATMLADAFQDYVEEAIPPETDPDVWDALTSPRVIHRTRNALGSLQQKLLIQVQQANAELEQVRLEGFQRGPDGKQDYFAVQAEQADWRRRIAGYRRLVDRRMGFVKGRIPRPPAPAQGEISKKVRKHNQAALETLARAVARHRERVLSGSGDEGDDEKLWEHLTTVTAITVGREELPLTEWLEHLDDLRENDDA